ncbi:hypothetical protein IJE86_06090 [bacterium]|nr:hypothetical protein [bacterium]
MEYQRWYDKDPLLKEALELLRLQPADKQAGATDFIVKLQEDIAKDVIERVYEMVNEYQYTGKRWYDHDPVLLKAIETLRVSSPETQRLAAKKLLENLEDMSKEENND